MMLLNSTETFSIEIDSINTIQAYENLQCITPREVILEINGIIVERISVDLTDKEYEDNSISFNSKLNLKVEKLLKNLKKIIIIISTIKSQMNSFNKKNIDYLRLIKKENNKYILKIVSYSDIIIESDGRIIVIRRE